MKNLVYDYVEYYVGMAKMVAYWHVKAMGFNAIGYKGPEQGYDTCSFLLTKNSVKIVITSSTTPNNYPVVSFVDRHGNGVKRISINVEDIIQQADHLDKVGAIIMKEIYEETDSFGVVKKLDVKIFDDNLITFSDYSNYNGNLLPGFVPFKSNWSTSSFENGLISIDHIACALRKHETVLWESYINEVFNSKTVFELEKIEEIKGKLGMQLKILQNRDQSINNVLVEPNDGGRASQIQHFIDGNFGTGIQHIAFETTDIVATINALKRSGTEFIQYPEEYYKIIEKKYPEVNVEKLKEASVLCEVKGDSLLLQTFTRPIGDRPTFFYEVIQRVNNYNGFGEGNITALFEAVEKSMDVVHAKNF